ncbi:MAG: hypothetical protein U0174_08175 [Polyangiaceae bacterium]
MTIESAETLYSQAISALSVGDTATARTAIGKLKGRGPATPHERDLCLEAEGWCFLCEGKPSSARDTLASSNSSPLLLSLLGVVAGTSEGALDVFAEALRATPSLELVTHALVGCGGAAHLAAVFEKPAMVTRFPDGWLLRSSEVVFRKGAFAACERICLAAFRAYGAPTHLFNAACAASRLGEVERALGHLRRALDAGFADKALLANDPDLAPVRADARFGSLLG